MTMDYRKDLPVEVGKRVRQLRKRKGMSMANLAEAADLSVQYLSEIEHGKKSMTMGKLLSVAESLGVSTDRLLRGDRGGDHTREELGRMVEDLSPLDREAALYILGKVVELLKAAGPEQD